MPFIGQDWRSPGEVWIKTNEGWEPMKLLRKSDFVRHYHKDDDNCLPSSSSTSSSPSPNFDQNDDVIIATTTTTSQSLSSSLDSNDDSGGGSSSSSSNNGNDSTTTTSSSDSSDSDNDELNDEHSHHPLHPNPHLHKSSDPVPVPGKRRHESGDSLAASSSLSSSFNNNNNITPETTKQQQQQPIDYTVIPDGITFADIVQRFQRSSSQPIPIDILKESSEQIEIYHQQPFYRITLNPTREVQGSNIISDAFYKLDFCNAIRDIRRFAYVSKLLHLLITQNLTSLSGNATKALFWMLEEIAKQVASNKQNIHVIRELLIEIREIVDKYLCWGRPLGSTLLWEQHLRTMERICEMTDAIEIVPPEDNDDKPSWSKLPEELIREILLRLSDYKDLERSAQACKRMNSLLNEEQHIWKQLVKYHFTKDQLRWALRNLNSNYELLNKSLNKSATKTTTKSKINIENVVNSDGESTTTTTTPSIDQKSNIDWERLFHLLRKKFGLKEEYADCLFLCRYCRCLFWKSKNHPCILENPDLTRQVLVTSPITGFKSQQQPHSINKFNNNNNNDTENNQRSSSLANIIRSRSLALNNSLHNNNSNNNNRQQQQQQQPPVVVQNLPFFEHPLVIQRQRINQDQNNEQDDDNSANQPPQTFRKAPLHVPITPHAFLKFFSL